MKTHTRSIGRLLGHLLLLVGLLVGFGLLAAREAPTAHAQSTLTVTDCSSDSQLQADVAQANSDNDGDVITFSCGGSADILLSSTLTITGKMTIDGGGQITLDGHQQYEVFQVNSTANLTLNALTITNGSASSVGGGISNSGTLMVSNSTLSSNFATGNNAGTGGGGIYNDGTLTISASTLTGNSSDADGGGIYNDGTLTISASTLSNNSTSNSGGGGIYNNGMLTVSASTLSNNSSTFAGGGISNSTNATLKIDTSTLYHNLALSNFGGEGGGIFNDGALTMSASTLSTNLSSLGGGLANNVTTATATISNSTFSGNITFGGAGGAIYNKATLTLSNSTVSGNTTENNGVVGGIAAGSGTSSTGSIVANNTSGNCSGTITDNGYNLSSDSNCGFTGTGSLLNTNPLLDPNGLQNNGGPTQTIALQQGSPASDTVPLNLCPSTDQRGNGRPDDASEVACDMGAYESSYADTDLGLTNMPSNITTNATGPSGAVVTYTLPTATDEPGDGSPPSVSCIPGPGSTFAAGKTTVTCTASDSDDTPGSVSKTFTVTVKPVLTLTLSKTSKISEGVVFSGTLATGVAYGTANPLTATITWGDGSSPDILIVTPASDGSYSVMDSHTYAEEGSYILTVTVGDHSRLGATRSETVKVADAALTITSFSKSKSGLTVTQSSIFTDADPGGTLSDYSASINWGDGNTTAATVASNTNGPGFTTQGSYTYANHGTYTVKLTITDAGGSTVSKTITITV